MLSEMLKKKNRKCYPLILNRMGTITIFMTIRIEQQIYKNLFVNEKDFLLERSTSKGYSVYRLRCTLVQQIYQVKRLSN